MTGTKPNRVRVDIFGTEYTLRGQLPSDHIRYIATMVDDCMNEIATQIPVLDAKRIAVLAAVRIAEDLLELRAEYADLLELLDEKTTATTEDINN